MAIITQIFRYLVGILFILSGLVKANDPLGLSYKMQEFFEVWNASLASSGFFAKAPLIATFDFFHGYTLPLSIIMITLEIVAGVALVVGWRRNAVLRLLLVLIVLFTFLTAYAYGSGKFKNCGCFGDCLPISPLASLIKDIALLLMIVALWWGRKYITPIRGTAATGVVAASLIGALAVQWYVLQYLPFADCLPFKKGANISQQMQLPAGARPDSFAILFEYEKAGKKYQFDAAHLPSDLASYKYVSRADKLVRKGNAEPPIKGFALSGISGVDSTQQILSLPEAYLLITEKLDTTGHNWMDDFKSLAQQATAANVRVYVATSSPMQQQAATMAGLGLQQVPLFALDFTAVRTAARSNPTLYHLKGGTIQEKWGKRSIGAAL